MKNQGLKAKLKSVVANISVDIFGIEKKVHGNVTGYLQIEAEKHGVLLKDLAVGLLKHQGEVHCFLRFQDGNFEQIGKEELIGFFVGKSNLSAFVDSVKIEKRVLDYMEKLAIELNTSIRLLNLKIRSHQNSAILDAYNGKVFLRSIPIKELINHFTK